MSFARVSRTSSSDHYAASLLAGGHYDVTVAAPGFKTVRLSRQARMGPLEGRSIAVLTLLGVLGIFPQSVAADDRVAPLECSQAAQDRIGTLSGTVADVSGAGISGALITASCGS